MKEKYLITPALPYANGSIHLGHLVEHVQVNVFSRALKMAGKDVLTVCGADSHGTPIEMNALKANVPPEVFVKECQKKQEQSFKDFLIEFDGGYGSTHTTENQRQAEDFFSALKKNGHIVEKEIEQLFDPKLGRFLPDRMVKGTCPKCKAKEQYGDSCEVCGATYRPTELIEPKSALSNETPILKKSVHLFVDLKNFETKLKEYILNSNFVSQDVHAYLNHWLREGLKEWDISRDEPYFGFLIPGYKDKYFYVWLDAPIGYVSLTERAAKLIGRDFKDYWTDANTKIIHFIGKDIVYFHALFWPSLLMAKNYTLPSKIYVHGMLTVNGEKMSKSRGTFISADLFKKHIEPQALRYYLASKLSNKIEDIDLNLDDFIQKVNTDLVNKVVNVVSRTLPLLHKYFNGFPAEKDENASDLLEKALNTIEKAKVYYEQNDPSKAIKEIIALSEDANKYLQDQQPWKVVLGDPSKAQNILTTALYLGKVSLALLKPILPNVVKNLEKILNNDREYNFENIGLWFAKEQSFLPYEHLFSRIDEKQVKSLLEESLAEQNQSSEKDKPETKPKQEVYATFDDFTKIDLRAAKVTKVEEVEGSDKLLSVTLDVGELGIKHVFAGLKEFIKPADLEGKTILLVANLAPRKMRFGISEGMILACGENNPQPIFVNGNPGDKIR